MKNYFKVVEAKVADPNNYSNILTKYGICSMISQNMFTGYNYTCSVDEKWKAEQIVGWLDREVSKIVEKELNDLGKKGKVKLPSDLEDIDIKAMEYVLDERWDSLDVHLLGLSQDKRKITIIQEKNNGFNLLEAWKSKDVRGIKNKLSKYDVAPLFSKGILKVTLHERPVPSDLYIQVLNDLGIPINRKTPATLVDNTVVINMSQLLGDCK